MLDPLLLHEDRSQRSHPRNQREGEGMIEYIPVQMVLSWHRTKRDNGREGERGCLLEGYF